MTERVAGRNEVLPEATTAAAVRPQAVGLHSLSAVMILRASAKEMPLSTLICCTICSSFHLGYSLLACAVSAFYFIAAVVSVVINLATFGARCVTFANLETVAKLLTFEAPKWCWNVCCHRNSDVADFQVLWNCW